MKAGRSECALGGIDAPESGQSWGTLRETVAAVTTAPSPAGTWEWIAIPGRFPPVHKRIWIEEKTDE